MRCPSPRRERLRAAVEREVVEADVDEETEAGGHGLEQRLGDGALARSEHLQRLAAALRVAPERLDELADVPQRHRADLRDVPSAELHRKRLGAQALALAGVARARHEKAPELVVGDPAFARVRILVVARVDAHVRQRGEARLEPRHDALVRALARAVALLAAFLRLGALPRDVAAEEDGLPLRLGELRPTPRPG